MTREFVAKIEVNVLGDKSSTFDVSLISTIGRGGIVLHACSEQDAYALADKLVAAINVHSIETVVVQ